MRVPASRRRACAALLLGLAAAPSIPAAARAQEASAPRGLLGAVTSGVTNTLDGAVTAVSDLTGGAATLPTTDALTSTVSGTLEVVGDAAAQATAPVVDGAPQVSLAVPGLARVDGAAVLNVVVGNRGDAACTPLLTIAITGADGVAVTAGETRLAQLAPRSSEQFVVPWPSGLASGTYAVEASASACGAPQAIALSVRLDADADAEQPGGGSSGGGSSGSSGTGDSSSPSSGASSGAGAGAAAGSVAGSSASGQQPQGAATGAGETPSGSGAPAPSRPGVSAASGAEPRRVERAAGRFAGDTGQMTGPPAPPELVRGTGADRIAGVRGGGVTATAAAPRAALPTSFEGAVQALPAVLERAAPALVVLGLIGSMFLLQEAVARRDPKLALAPVEADDDLDFAEPGALLRRLAGGAGRGAEPPAAP